jgi:predicted enzyme related to lactoylglutathione lyase
MAEDWARPVVHWEIQALDADKMAAFYGTLFNWDIGEGRVKTIPAGIGAPEPTINGHIRGSDASRVALYIQVLKLEDTMAKATELGGSVVRERFQIATGPHMAWIDDPEGNRIVLVQQ